MAPAEAAREVDVDVVIVGGGLAGAATAFQLARAGVSRIVLLERETVPGVHASGQNAAMVRRVVAEPAIAALAREGAAFLLDPVGLADPVATSRSGSLLLGRGAAWQRLCAAAEEARAAGEEVELLSPAAARARVPLLDEADFEGAVYCPQDGVCDVAALLHGYLAEARRRGVEVCFDEPVLEVLSAGGRVEAVVTASRTLRPRVVVNAAGAWASVLGRMAGAAPIPMRPLRRHLYCTSPVASVDRGWPWVWDEGNGYYFRPESGGALLCACDEDEQPPCLPGVAPGVAEALGEKLTRHVPALAGVPVARAWAGLRTFAPDRQFVIGWDPVLAGFFWVAGLGGHGVTASAAVGALAARLLQDGPGAAHPAFDPSRFG